MVTSVLLNNLIEQASMRLAICGDGDGNIDVPDRPNFILGRIGGVGGPVAEIRVGAVKPNYDDAIYILRISPNQAAGWREVFWIRDGSDPTLPAPVVGSIYVT